MRYPTTTWNEHALGALVDYLLLLTIGDLPSWAIELAAHLMKWTGYANGPHGEEDCEQDNRPFTWNAHFFDFLGILCVALPHDDVVAMFLNRIMQFKDEPFYDRRRPSFVGLTEPCRQLIQNAGKSGGNPYAAGRAHSAGLELQAPWT